MMATMPPIPDINCHVLAAESGNVRADRLLSLVLLLRNRGRMTAAALAAELEVSVRTVLRDVEALSGSGIPVYAERGRDGGFALLPGFTTDLTGLTPDEAVALLTARSPAASDALGLGGAFASAMRKVIAALPVTARQDAVNAAERVLVRSGGWLADHGHDPALATVQRAVFAGRRLRIRYATRVSAPEWRTVDPIGLVSAAGWWYLLALRDGQDRTYRVSRIAEAVELDQPANRPDDVDLEKLWLRRRAEFRAERGGYPVTARVRAGKERRLVTAATKVTVITPQERDWLHVAAEFGDHQHAASVLWSLAPDAEALSPPDLRADLAERASTVHTQHSAPAHEQ